MTINIRKIAVAGLLLIVFLLVAEVIALLRLRGNIARYQTYWTNRNKTEQGEFIYLALGDSAAQGLGASKPQNGYVGLLSQRVAKSTGKTVRTINLSKNGAKIRDVLDTQLPQTTNLKPNLVTIEIGANDIATFDAKKFTNELGELADRLPAGTYVANMPYFGSRASRRPAAYQATTIIESIVKAHPKLVLVDLQSQTKARDSLRGYAPDYFHPNNRAYIGWADAFWSQIDGQL